MLENEEEVRKVRQDIERSKRTSTNFRKYGGNFWVGHEDCGTVNIVIVSPKGDVTVTTSTINTL